MTVSNLSAGLLTTAAGFNPLGILVLGGGIALMVCFYITQRNKQYQKQLTEYNEALKKYEQQLAEYNAAVVALGQPQAPSLDGGTVAAITAAVLASAPGPAGEVLLTGVDEKTAAMVMAIVCEAVGGDPAQLRFASVRAL